MKVPIEQFYIPQTCILFEDYARTRLPRHEFHKIIYEDKKEHLVEIGKPLEESYFYKMHVPLEGYKGTAEIRRSEGGWFFQAVYRSNYRDRNIIVYGLKTTDGEDGAMVLLDMVLRQIEINKEYADRLPNKKIPDFEKMLPSTIGHFL